MKILPIYDKLFSVGSTPTKSDWDDFRTKADSADVVMPREVDFCVSGRVRTWSEVAYAIMMIVIKIILFPWIIYEGIKYLVGRIAMKVVLLAQLIPKLDLEASRRRVIRKNPELIIRHVTLQKEGVNYRGLLVASEANISNGKWALHATGNFAPVERSIPEMVLPYLETKAGEGFNVLLVNEPHVGSSEGTADPMSMANSQEVGISFLELGVRAKEIVLTGHSIGGASIGEAISQHEFKSGIIYRVIRLMTFDKLTNMTGGIGRKILNWLGYEMDNVASSKKLEELKIPEIIVQGGEDGVIDDAGLIDALQRNGVTKNKTFQVIPKADHNYFPHEELKRILFKPEVKSLFQRILGRIVWN